jgi:hypothetical protein
MVQKLLTTDNILWKGFEGACNYISYAACIEENEPKVSQARIAAARSISAVTLRKRFSDILGIILGIITDVSKCSAKDMIGTILRIIIMRRWTLVAR